tara:strand:+ start:195 stop:338 length:144 start_codon:yes stop_codon:yes gene_type:complete
MYWVEVRFDFKGKERWEGLTKDQAYSVYNSFTTPAVAGAWYVRMGEM